LPHGVIANSGAFISNVQNVCVCITAFLLSGALSTTRQFNVLPIATMDMATITTLPHEILHGIFKSVDITDLASICLTCRKLQRFISDNHMLFKDIYLQKLVLSFSSMNNLCSYYFRMNRLRSKRGEI
jgi:hypothetical protein